MKRFYKVVSVHEEAGGYAVLLDGKPVKTPGKQPFLAPNKAIADSVMQEWAAQKDKIIPHEMPLTQIISTKIDRVSVERDVITKMALDYLDTDLLCYRADHPPALAEKQAAIWDPHLARFEKRFGAKLSVTTTLEALRQPAFAHSAVRKFITGLDDDRFTILQMVTAISGSLVLALAFTEKTISAGDVFIAARVEESYKAELYNEARHGPDPAQEKKDQAYLRDLQAAEQFLDLLGT